MKIKEQWIVHYGYSPVLMVLTENNGYFLQDMHSGAFDPINSERAKKYILETPMNFNYKPNFEQK